MNLEELQKEQERIERNSQAILDNMQAIADESNRVADVAHNSREILDNLNREFEEKTGLHGKDVPFLFLATSLQLCRIIILNKLTEIEKAGKGNKKEDWLHKKQEEKLGKYDNGEDLSADEFYAPLNQIISTLGVPYDATDYAEEKYDLFKGGNHRFSTLGHDPILGLVFGTGNILTNTITCVDRPLTGFKRKNTQQIPRKIPVGIPKITTNHVVYREGTRKKSVLTNGYKHKVDAIKFDSPKIAEYCPTTVMLGKAIERIDGDRESVVAALIKQLIHIGTDLFTPDGIQIPAANLVLSNTAVEKLTKYVSTGDLLKVGASTGIAVLINLIIGVIHGLMYNEETDGSKELYSVRTRKVIMVSNTIATGSNLIWVGANVIGGDKTQLRNLDIGGLLVTMHRLINDPKFINLIKEEYIIGNFNQMIQGEDLQLKEIEPAK